MPTSSRASARTTRTSREGCLRRRRARHQRAHRWARRDPDAPRPAVAVRRARRDAGDRPVRRVRLRRVACRRQHHPLDVAGEAPRHRRNPATGGAPGWREVLEPSASRPTRRDSNALDLGSSPPSRRSPPRRCQSCATPTRNASPSVCGKRRRRRRSASARSLSRTRRPPNSHARRSPLAPRAPSPREATGRLAQTSVHRDGARDGYRVVRAIDERCL